MVVKNKGRKSHAWALLNCCLSKFVLYMEGSDPAWLADDGKIGFRKGNILYITKLVSFYVLLRAQKLNQMEQCFN